MLVSASSFYADIGKGYKARGTAAPNNAIAPVGSAPAIEKLSSQQQSEVQALINRDREVRNHEQAHLSAAGGIAVSGAHYNYTTGPDGKRYATGGDVGIDTSTVSGDPEATIRKAETIRRAALAPANPSSQDHSVAAKAAAMANKARTELLRLQQEASTTGSRLNVRA
jgi:hypothetical protein